MAEKVVAVFGAGKTAISDDAFKQAFEAGNALGKAGYTLINGGYGGTMLASAKGAAQAGAKVIGVTCQAFKRSTHNEFVCEEVSTNCLDERLDMLISRADAYVVLPGGTGTLLELAKVWELKNKHFLPERKPVILLGVFWKPLFEMIIEQDADAADLVAFAKDAQEMISILKQCFEIERL